MRFFRQTLLLVCLGLPCALWAQPVANDDIFSTPEDTEVTQNLVSNDTDPGFGIDPTTVDLDISSPLIVDNTITTADGTFSVDASGILTFVPTQDFFGTTFIQYTVRNTDAIPATSSPANIQINVTAVNDAPVISALTDIAVNENTTSPAEAFSVSDIDNPAASLLVTAASNNPTLLPLTGIELVHVSGGDWTVAVTPAVGRAGNATVTLTLTDGSKTDKGTFAVTVTIPGNDNPVITPISNQNINEDTSTGAIAFTISDTETPVASLTIDAVSGNTSLVPTGRISILGTGGNLTIEVTPLPNVFGTATISLNLADADGGTAFEQFEVVVASVNDIPTITTIANQSINEDGVTPSLPFTIGDVETPAAGLTILKSSNDLSIVPLTGIAITGSGAARNVVVTPLTNKFGNVRITLTVRDVDGGEVVQEFDVDIASVNDLPQISAIADQVINEDESTAALSFNVSDIETGATSLNVTTSSTNISIVPLANIVITGTGGTRSVVVTPVANLTGAVDITLIVEDADGGKTPEIFKVTINPVNDAPAISALSDISVNENTTSAAFAFAVSDIDNSAAVLSVTAGSNNTTLLPVAGINLVHVAAGDWTVAVTPTADQTGTATVTLTVSDGAKTVEGTFLVTVNAVANTNPTISAIADQNINEDGSTVSLPFTIGDTETPVASLTVSKASSDVSIVPLTGIAITGTGPALNVTVTPLPNKYGSVTISLTVTDGSGALATENFAVVIAPVNDVPVISTIGDQVINEDESTVSLNFSVSDVETAATALTVTTASSNTAVIPLANIVITGTGGSRSVVVTPAANLTGAVDITLTVSDTDGGTAPEVFKVIINPVNDAPVISALTNISINESTSSPATPFTVSDVDNAVASLTVSAGSSNVALLPVAGITLVQGTGGSWTVSVTPTVAQSGIATVTLMVSDGAKTTQGNFLVTVNANSNPTITSIADQAINEDSSTPSIAFTIGDAETPVASLTLSKASSDVSIVPLTGIVITGIGATRNVVVTPAANKFGPVIISLTVTDASGGVSTEDFNVVIASVNDLPQITAIANQTINEDGAAGPLNFTISDVETAAASLTVTPSSSNTTIVPVSNIVVSGSGGSRTVVVMPVANLSGSVDVTLTITDANGGSTPMLFTVTIDPVDDAPTISVLTDISINQNTTSPATPFSVADIDSPVASLTVTALTSNATLLPVAGINLVHPTGGNWTVDVTPVVAQTGSATVTLIVSDGTKTAQGTFLVNVNAVANTNPTISAIADQVINEDGATPSLAFTIADAETSAGTLTLVKASSNTSIVPLTGIAISGVAGSRSVIVTPSVNKFGTVTISLVVSDGDGGTATEAFDVTITSINDLPLISAIGNQTVNEDEATASINFTISDIETAPASLAVTATSSNTAIIPVANIVIGGSAGSRSVVVTPAANLSGLVDITLTVVDADGGTAPATFQVTVNAVNDAPTMTAIADQNINEDGQTAALNFTVGDVETPGALTVTASSSNASLVNGAGIALTGTGSSRTVRVTPLANAFGSTTITLRVGDGTDFTEKTFQVVVNSVDDAPSITGISPQSINENSQTGPLAFTIGDVETLPSLLTLIPASSNLALVDNTDVVFGGSGSLRSVNVKPKLNQFGTATITLTVSDGAQSAETNFLLTVASVDAPPTITAIGDFTINEDVASSAMPFTVGDPDTPLANLSVAGVSDNTALISNANISLVPGAPGDYTVQVTPSVNASGVANITLTVTDDAAETITTTFQVTVTAVNDLPTMSTIANKITNEDTPAAAFNVTVGDVETAAAALVVTGASSNSTLIPDANIVVSGTGATRSIIVTPAADQHGVSTITLTVNDGTGGTFSRAFSVTVDPVNDAPTITAISNQTITEDQAGGTGLIDFTVDDVDGNALTVTANSDDLTLVPLINIVLAGSGSARTVRVSPTANQFGTANVTLTVSDGTLNGTTSFTVTVTSVNDAPTISAVANQNIDEGTSTGALSFTVGDIETAPGSLIVNSTSSNTTLVPNANVVLAGSGAARTVTVTPAPGENGASTITLTVNDGTTTGQTTFVVTVASVDDPPTITAIGSQSTNEDTPSGAIAFTIGDPDTALGSLTLAGSSANTILIPNGNIVFGGTGASRTVTITPDANQNGSSTITITVSDASTNVATSFSLTVVSVNDTPTITVIGDQVTNEDTPSSDISFTVGDQETAAGSLTITTVSDNTALIPNANIDLGGAGAARTVKMTPAANASGVANITVTVSDGVASASRTFKLTVSDVNDAPTISAIADQNIAEDTNTGAISFTIGDVETPPASLILSQSSSNTTLFPLANIVLGGSGASRTVTVTPAANQNGTATISIIVDDGTTTTTRDFQVVVTPVNDPPAISGISNRTINEDEDTGNITFTISDPDDLVSTLSLSGSSSDTDIVPDANITFTGTTGTRTIKVVPAPNKNGIVTITVSLSDGVNTKTRTFTVTITPINDLPVITAQQPLTINEGEQLLLTLSQLTVVDPDNTPAQLTLYVTGGPDYSISGANTITPNPAFHGNLSVPVFVGDGTGFSTPYNMVIAVNSTNDPPVIAAQSPLVTDEDQTITLQPSNFTITDLDGDMSFTLILSPGANYTFTGTTVTPAANYNGVIFVGVRANDGQASSVAVYNTQITINPVNDAPTVTGQATLNTSEETPLTLLIGNFIVSDPEPTSYTLSVLPPAPGSNYTLTGNTITPDLNYFGTLTVPITVSDGFANSAVYNTTVTVTDVNDPPVINSQNSLSTVEDIPIALDLSNFNVTDVDDPNYPASFSLTVLAGTDYTYAGTTITPTLDFSGTLNINVQIRDPRGANSATFVANLTVTKAADAPNISGQKTVSVLEEDSRIIILDDLIYTDTDTPPEDLQLIVSPGANYTVTGNTITPDANFFGTLTVGVKLFDGEANSNVWPLLVTVDNVNDPPSFNAISNLTILEDAAIQTVTITGISAGPNEGTELLNFTYVSDNTNLIKSSGILESPTYNHLAPNNTITFKPEANQFGTANITVNLIDGSGTIFPYVFAVTVTSVNDAPTLTAIPATIIPEDANEQIIILTGLSPGGGTPEADQSLTFVVSADNQIFETLLIEPTTVTGSSTASLKIKPKPNANGPSNITIRVVDNGESAPPNVNFFIRTFSMSVTPVNDAPNVTSIPSTQAQPGVAYEYQIQATDADGDIITITSPGLPAWLTLTQVSNGKATITGTPPLGTTGDVKINLAVTDPSGPAQDLGYTITVNSPPVVSNISLTTEEDIPSLALRTADFQTGFTDPDGNQLNEITIMMLPKHGDLFKAGNVPVAIGETFSGTDISTLTYKPLADYDKRDTIQWNGADGYHLYSVLPAYVFIIMTPVNDAPRITYIEPVADTLKYRLGSEELVLLTPKFDAMDPEEDDIVSAEIAFKTIDNFDYTTLHDYLVFDKTSKIDGTFSAASGTLKLTGKATAAEYVAAIRKIRYQYIDAKELELDLRSVTITLSDGKSSEPKSRIIEPIYNFEDLHIPTAFTPNEDTVNESWEITSPSGTLFLYADAEIKVYNKHGVLLWQTKGFDEHWNGVYDGSLLPSDTYFYTIDLNFNKVRYKGTVTILR